MRFSNVSLPVSELEYVKGMENLKCNTLQGKWQERGETHQFLPHRKHNASALEDSRLTVVYDQRLSL